MLGNPQCLLVSQNTPFKRCSASVAGQIHKGAWTGLKVQCAKVQFVPDDISLSPFISWTTQQDNGCQFVSKQRHLAPFSHQSFEILYFIRNLGRIFQLHGKRLELLILAFRAKQMAFDDTTNCIIKATRSTA